MAQLERLMVNYRPGLPACPGLHSGESPDLIGPTRVLEKGGGNRLQWRGRGNGRGAWDSVPGSPVNLSANLPQTSPIGPH